MTVPRWLVPLLAIVAAAAVGVAGALLGMRVATPETVEVSSGTAIVPVLSPIAEGEEPPAADPGSGELPFGDAIAEREVVLPGSDPEVIDPSLTELVDALAEGGDPVFILMELDGEADAEYSDAADDPCAPRDGTPGDECPDGLRSTVLSLTGVSEFRAGGQAFPPTLAQFREHGNPSGGSLYCDGLTAGAGEVPFGIVSTAPGTFTVRYWPSERPGEVRVVDGVSSSDADRDGFLSAIEDGDDPLTTVGLPRHCFTLPDIEADTIYTAIIQGVDVLERASSPHTVRFNSAGAPVRPGAQIATVGENLVFVSALHPRDESAEARVVLVEGDAAPSCAVPLGGGRSLHPLTDAEAEVDADTLVALNVRPEFTRKRVQTFVVPEGSTALVCVRWYRAGSAPSWEREQPVFESSVVLQSPDRVLPSVRLESVEGFDPALESIGVSFATAEGTACGLPFSWRSGGDLALPLDVCGARSLAAGGVRSAEDRLWDVGFRGDLVASLTARLESGAESTTSYLIPARDGGCRGDCAVPPRMQYSIPLDDVAEPEGLCGSVFGAGCTPPTREVAAGVVGISVGYEQGSSNGRSAWNVTPTVDDAPEYERPERPQLDLGARWAVHAPSPGRSYTVARYPLRVDRPSEYLLRLLPAEGGDPAGCHPGGEPLELRGAVERTATLELSGVCVGESYFAELELVAEDGARSTWGLTDREAWWGPGALVQVPGLEVTVDYRFTAQGFTNSHVGTARIQIGSSGVDLLSQLERCDRDGVLQASGSVPATIAASTRVLVTIDMQSSGEWSPEECSRNLDGAPPASYSVIVNLEELMSREGVLIEAPDAFRSTVRLHARSG